MPVPPLLSDICYRIREKEHLAIVMNLKRDLRIGLGCHVWASREAWDRAPTTTHYARRFARSLSQLQCVAA